MLSYDKTSQRLAIGLALLAGFIDALGFIHLGGVFISFMSGNSTRFAVGLSGDTGPLIILAPLIAIILFVTGVIAGRVIRHFRTTMPATSILVFMTGALASAGILHEFDLTVSAISLMVIAMGSANNVFFREGEVAIGVTYMTGTLVKLGQRLAGRLLGEKDGAWLPYFLLWTGLISGAILGSFSYGILELRSLWAGFALCAVLAFACYRIENKTRR